MEITTGSRDFACRENSRLIVAVSSTCTILYRASAPRRRLMVRRAQINRDVKAMTDDHANRLLVQPSTHLTGRHLLTKPSMPDLRHTKPIIYPVWLGQEASRIAVPGVHDS